MYTSCGPKYFIIFECLLEDEENIDLTIEYHC